ncbi:hypothetical protein [Candidatus Thiothrix anitrata]|uniref:Uncharacterized protein n=1 Tax=Candidatus Thiothrix anitrata TaxID=2823902 RepID=A0ABX7X7J4_9GAMM|nr:hypothetical protein [Candidatus Thiothrix anitrata]QTR50988.1 hypothetical protein J8380_05330 [Candidatus Thiothrix anitrata]
MDTIALFTLEILISLSLSITVLFVISRPLLNALRDLCVSEKQADFWLSYTRTMLLLAPLLLVLVIDGMYVYTDALDSIRVTLIAALTGILLGLIIVGKRVFAPVARASNNNREVKRA